ncbi:MAG: hypothetical protein K2Q26_06065 [Bdellovibrionales bacterium]|nr:hypothetical protein [Bdellovibrionales bacterium]
MLSILKEFGEFLIYNKKWWMIPVFVVFFLLGTLIFFTQGTALSPFVYTFF